jgi:hypothetical protein
MTTVEKIKAIEDEMAKTQKNKAPRARTSAPIANKRTGNVFPSRPAQGMSLTHQNLVLKPGKTRKAETRAAHSHGRRRRRKCKYELSERSILTSSRLRRRANWRCFRGIHWYLPLFGASNVRRISIRGKKYIDEQAHRHPQRSRCI